MKIEQFKIGDVFFASAGFKWLCTDKGTRTITAIMLEPDKDKSWFSGPPYLLNETVFDEHDILACYLDERSMFEEKVGDFKMSSHPNFLSDDVFKMMKEKINTQVYTRKNLLKRDRVANNGEILHPYMAIIKEKVWYIKTFEVFSRKYSEINEDEFKKLKISTENDLKTRAKDFN